MARHVLADDIIEHVHHRSDDEVCQEHSGIVKFEEFTKDAIRDINDKIETIWDAINQIKGWVIVGSAALILQLGLFIVGKIWH